MASVPFYVPITAETRVGRDPIELHDVIEHGVVRAMRECRIGECSLEILGRENGFRDFAQPHVS